MTEMTEYPETAAIATDEPQEPARLPTRLVVTATFTGAQAAAVAREAARTGAAYSGLVRDAAAEQLRLRDEYQAGNVGKTVEMMTDFVQRQESELGRLAEQLATMRLEINATAALLDALLKLYLSHTPELSAEGKQAAMDGFPERYRKAVSHAAGGINLESGTAQVLPHIVNVAVSQ